MPLPSFLAPTGALSRYLPPRSPAALGGASQIAARRLAVAVQRQEQTQWCWAAVAVTISIFFDPASTWSQCAVACQALDRTDCCSDAGVDPAGCNRPWYLDRALEVTGNFENMEGNALSFADLGRQIASDRPLGCRIGWAGGGGHFVIVYGQHEAADGTRYLDVADPIHLTSRVPYDSFLSFYRGEGHWTHSYRTEPQGTSGVVSALGGGRPVRGRDIDALGA